jgi:hypothetical protein
MSAVKRVGLVSDRMSYITLRGHWHHHCPERSCPTEDKIDVKDSFCKELRCMSDKFPKYYVKVLLREFSAKVESEDIF